MRNSSARPSIAGIIAANFLYAGPVSPDSAAWWISAAAAPTTAIAYGSQWSKWWQGIKSISLIMVKYLREFLN